MEKYLRIGFAVENEKEEIIKISYDWSEISCYKHLDTSTNRGVFKLIRALELNKNFVSRVLSIRRKYQIPDLGFEFKNNREKEDYTGLRTLASKDLDELIKNIRAEENLDLIFDEFIEKNFVRPDYEKIQVIVNSEDMPKLYVAGNVLIEIFNKISKNEFFKTLEKEWPKIEKSLDRIETRKPFEISMRDLKIVKLKDIDGMKFKNIANFLQKDIPDDDIDNIISEDLVKTAYHRAKKKINNLFKP